METLEKVLGNRTREPAVDVSTTLKDPSQRQAHMRKLVEAGQAKISTLSKITQGVGDAVQFVLSAKAMIDLAIQNIPQVALPWAGVCIGLQETHQPVRDSNTLRKEIYRDEKNTQCLQNLLLTDPRHDKRRIIETKGCLLADAYRWILDNTEFRQWCDGEQSRLLWIKGDPGKGKTILLCGIIDKLQSLALGTGLLSFFFCQATDTRINSTTTILRGLIYLLLDQQPSLIPHARKKYDHAGKALFEDANGWIALSEIFRHILQDPSLESAYLVIDALDKCGNDLPKFLKFIIEISSTFPHVRWIVSSRNWPNIEETLEAVEQKTRLSLELNEKSVLSARAVQNHLTRNANGTVLTKLNIFPPGLSSLYQRMMDQICHSDEADLCKQVLAVLYSTYRPITIQELTSFINISEGISDDLEFLIEIVGLCGSFLTLRESTIYFVHQSAKDFLLGGTATEVFPAGIEDIHQTVFSRSLRVMNDTLRRDIYSLGAPGSSIDNAKLSDPDPLAAARYTYVYWVDHLHGWQSSDSFNHPDVFQDGGNIDDFLRQHYLYWLEALSLCRSMLQGILSMAKLESILQQKNVVSQLPSLVYNIRRFVQYCSWLVENHPLQVYASALMFSPARSITRDLFKQEVQRWITTKPVLVVSGSGDKTVKIWDAATGIYTQTLKGHSHYIYSIAFSPDSKLVVSGSGDKTMKIWDTATGICTQMFKGYSDSIWSITFSPDLKLVVSGSVDKTMRIWDAVTGVCTQTLKGHSYYVRSIAFSPDSKLVVSGSDGRWITRDLENWLWLPPGCQAASSAIAGSTIAIGCSSGRVLIMTFPTDN
ncbi:hypothetical protein B0T25DRAFT_591653 [Lasiosphaeria hispida]|uniref:NACHT domain-containing protein n=1 Tax=Lasiosphaeria hispida TaxID=260671 RepID=A0AAJ0HE94_9PEZI|nr:hypothetical protein B0T25DRAFT_591653 [Lasiosphaeria hispida]